MAEREWSRVGNAELVAALRLSQDRLNAEYGELLAILRETLQRNVAGALGYRSLAQLLRDVQRIGPAEANRRVAQAEAVTTGLGVSGAALPPRLPTTAAAVAAGTIGAEQVEVIRRAIADLPPEVDPADIELAEKTLVEAAHTIDPAGLTKLGRAITARLDQDGRPPTEAELRHPVNELRWTPRRDGGLTFTGRLAAEGGALLTTVLSPLAKPRPAADGTADSRTRAERHGDAFVDALRLAANSDELPTEGGERPTLVVTMTLETLREQTAPALLGDSTLIDARQARRLACDAAVIPAVLGARSEPLELGRKTRIVSTAMRRALILRDGGCAFPGCTMPPRQTDAHPRHHWANGGDTDLDNLVLLCGTHHDLIHHSDWEVQHRDGVPEFIPPPYVDPHRRPRRNPIHNPPSESRNPPNRHDPPSDGSIP